jgi:dolichol-phosphate mannosyltransferase
MKPNACLVLPTFNEAENVRILIPLIFQEASKIESHELHVLVVDDSSPDGTQKVVRELMSIHRNLHLLAGEKKGLGEAYKRGFVCAINDLQADLIFEMDADFQHDPSLLPLFVTLSNYGFSLVIGSRFAPGGSTTDFPWFRRLISLTGNLLVRMFGGLPPLTDCTSGYRCIKASFIQKCCLAGLSSRGYSFQSSLLCELIRNGARVIEVPIVFGTRDYGESKLALRDQTEFVVNLLRLRFRNLTLRGSRKQSWPAWAPQRTATPLSSSSEGKARSAEE